jgi:hypothetical protein
MVDKEDYPEELSEIEYRSAASRGEQRDVLTDEQFNYMSKLNPEELKSYLGREGEEYQERLVTVLKGSLIEQ